MRFVILFLITFNAYALTNNECRWGVLKCRGTNGVPSKVENKKLFCANMTPQQAACVNAQAASWVSEDARRKGIETAKKAAVERLKSVDCNSISDQTMKDLCLVSQ